MSVLELPPLVGPSIVVVRPATEVDRFVLAAEGHEGGPNGRTLVAVTADEVLGAISVAPSVDPAVAEVTSLFVLARHRRRGVARLLLRGAAANIVATGCAEAVAVVGAGDDRARRLLGSAGWRAEPGPTADAVVFRRAVLTPIRAG